MHTTRLDDDLRGGETPLAVISIKNNPLKSNLVTNRRLDVDLALALKTECREINTCLRVNTVTVCFGALLSTDSMMCVCVCVCALALFLANIVSS